MPPTKTTTALEGGDDEPQLTADEMAAFTKFHKSGYDESWSKKDRADACSALNKVYGPGGFARSGGSGKLFRWLEKVGLLP